MSTGSADTAIATRKIEYLSPAAQVSMADRWFDIASTDHFWVRRRFEVLQQLAGRLVAQAAEIAEIGCGHGLLQRQVEDAYAKPVAGFDLNDYALKQNVSRRSPVFCYDIFHADQNFRSRFDVIFLFDVLEHISDEENFLRALLFHLALDGKLILNVPAGQWAYSEYDKAAGHVRRYSIRTLRNAATKSGLGVKNWTYWGLPLVPTLALRKLWLRGKQDNQEIISSGFDSRSGMVNGLLHFVSKCEVTPQSFLGTSLMAILERTPV
jgi:2-polyprenyl-3-methyl-5-hydroxy-6-metoxy-1,4-benzoquinol methylase